MSFQTLLDADGLITNHNQTILRPTPGGVPQHNQTVSRPLPFGTNLNHNQTVRSSR